MTKHFLPASNFKNKIETLICGLRTEFLLIKTYLKSNYISDRNFLTRRFVNDEETIVSTFNPYDCQDFHCF